MATRTAATTPAAPLKNTRWEAFVQHLLEGMPQGRAYEAAGYKARGNSAEVHAAKLVRKRQVAERLDHLKREAAHRAVVTLEDVLRGLLTEATLYGEGANHSARVSAWSQLLKHVGGPDRIEITHGKGKPLDEMTDEELEEVIARATASRHPR